MQPATAVRNLIHAARVVLPRMVATRRGHTVVVLLPESGHSLTAATPAASVEHADLLVGSLRNEMTDLGVRFTRILSGPMERNGQLTPGDVTQAVGWALGQPRHLAVCDIDIRAAPLARPALTRREREVLAWTACGKTTDEISRILDLSVSGVNFHITNFVSKLDTCNKTAAVARAAQLGILP
jgi:DNA-binding CsgD family transcriptional regulator